MSGLSQFFLLRRIGNPHFRTSALITARLINAVNEQTDNDDVNSTGISATAYYYPNLLFIGGIESAMIRAH